MSQPLVNPALLPPGVGDIVAARAPQGVQAINGPAFAELLARTPNVLFSRHALERLQRRGIDLGEQQLHRLGDGVDRAAGKGSRASVVFVDGTAFVVAVPKRTVLTAVDPEHMREQVFTNIDSAVIA
ncbi:MAG: flagellar biosynthesis protein [Actinobacteria bacterium]|nr:flagellar biosynthesis protein [Actinomycetota bacterium]